MMKKNANSRQISQSSKRKMKPLLFIVAMLLQFVLVSQSAFAQNITVKGRVIKEDGQPLAKTSVTLKGGTVGTSTDDNGDFVLSVPANATLVFSAVDFISKEVKVNNRTTINVTITAKDKSLSEVIVVGYGTQRKKDVTGAVASIKGDVVREIASPNIAQALQGRIAGVDIARNGTTPGSGGQIRIRGNRGLNTGNDPFIVVDGIPYPGSINDLNNDDIANIEILKDASSTAIYGSRGSNGVILITTKRGKMGKPQISYNAYYGISNIIDQYQVYNGAEFKAFRDAAQYSPAAPYSVDELAGINAGTSTNWQDLLYRTGTIQNHELGISGGNDGVQYSISGGYFNDKGVMPLQSFDRFSVRGTLDARITKFLKIGLNTINTVGITNGAGINPLYNTLRLSPLTSPYKADGSLNVFPLNGTLDATATANPLTITKEGQNIDRQRRLRTFNSVYIEAQILKSLKLRYNVGLDYRQENRGIYNGWGTTLNADRTGPAVANASIRNGDAYTITSEVIANYDNTFARKHRVGVTGLFSTQIDKNFNTRLDGTNFPSDQVQYFNFNLAQTITAPADGNNFSKGGLLSLMGRVNYAYDDRYLLTATFRRDGSNVFPVNKYLNYSAFAVGWNISNEKFLKNVKQINNLKLRIGYGATGNQGVPNDATRGSLASNRYNFGATNVQGYFISGLPNIELRWENTKTTNVGLDFGVLNNRITGSIEVYKQSTDNLIVNKALPTSNGVNGFWTNAAATEGRGVEITLSTVNYQKGDFEWSTDFNFARNREKIVRLEEPTKTTDVGNGWFVGQPINVIYDFKKIGIWQTNEAVQAAAFGRTPGDIKIADIAGGPDGKPDGRITDADRTIVGTYQPDWVGGITNRFRYKNFDLSFVAFARWGGNLAATYLQPNNAAQGYFALMNGRVNAIKVDYWTPTNPTNAFPKPDGTTEAIQFGSTLGYYDATFIKMRTITLGYEFTKGLISRAKLTSARLYVTAQNPFIIYSPFVKAGLGFDPEGNGFGNTVNSQGGVTSVQGRAITVGLSAPSTRQFIVGLNVKL
jgi:TonB-dependent starch-binding outer membrane protein SusC